MLNMKNGKLLVLPANIEREIKGVYYTEDQKNKCFKGTVVATPTGENGYEVGDVILYGEFAGDEIEIEGKTHLIIDMEQVYAVEDNNG